MTLEQVREQFDVPRLIAFNRYCERFPPQHTLVAAYFGFGKPKKQENDPAEIAAIMAGMREVPR